MVKILHKNQIEFDADEILHITINKEDNEELYQICKKYVQNHLKGYQVDTSPGKIHSYMHQIPSTIRAIQYLEYNLKEVIDFISPLGIELKTLKELNIKIDKSYTLQLHPTDYIYKDSMGRLLIESEEQFEQHFIFLHELVKVTLPIIYKEYSLILHRCVLSYKQIKDYLDITHFKYSSIDNEDVAIAEGDYIAIDFFGVVYHLPQKVYGEIIEGFFTKEENISTLPSLGQYSASIEGYLYNGSIEDFNFCNDFLSLYKIRIETVCEDKLSLHLASDILKDDFILEPGDFITIKEGRCYKFPKEVISMLEHLKIQSEY